MSSLTNFFTNPNPPPTDPRTTEDPWKLAVDTGQVPPGMSKEQYYASLRGGAANATAAAGAAGDTAATTAQTDPNNTTANPLPPGMSRDDYYKALAAGGQNEQAAATGAGAATLTADEANPNSMASHPTDPNNPGAGNPDNSGALSGPGPFEQWAAEHGGDFDHKSAAETLYDQGMAGTDPYYNYATDKATRSINDAAAARGNWNSSAALYDIGDATANLRGQQAAGMKDEAAASDAAYNSRVTGAENLYKQWQDTEEKRLGGAQSTATDLSHDQANIIAGAFKNAGDLSNQDNLEAFNAQLQKLGIDPTSAATKDFLTLLGIGGSTATAG